MNKPKIALLIDLASLRVSCEGFKKLFSEIEEDFEIVNVKFYSYVAKRNRDFNEYIAAKGFDAVTPIASRRRNKLDTRQVIDGTIIGMTSKVDAVGIASGDGDILPIVSYLKLKGMNVFDVNIEESIYTPEFSGFIPVKTSYLREGYAAPTIRKAPVKKAPKVIPTAPVAPAKEESRYVKEVKEMLSQGGVGASILDKYRKR